MADIYAKTRMSSRVVRFRKSAAERYGLEEKDVHIGHLTLEGLLDAPDMTCQIDFTTAQEESNRSVAERTCSLASAMVNAGLKPGDPVIIMSNNHMDVCIPYFACHFGGYPMCAIDPSLGQNDLTRLFPYIFPKIVFCVKACEDKIKEAFKANNQEGIIVVFEDKESDLEAFVKKHNGTHVNYRPAVFDQSKTTAWLMLTSGTTGLPKVAVIPFDTLLNGVQSWWSPFPQSCDIILAMATLQWVSSLIYFISGPLKGSTRVQSSGPLTPMKIVEIVNKYRPNTTAFTPFLLGHFLNVGEKTVDLSCFKYILIAGSAMPKPLLDRFRNICDAFLYLAYGMTELLAPIFDYDDNTPFGSTGKPQAQYEFKIVDDEGKTLEGPHKTGELWVKGSAFFTGYLNNPEETKTMLTDDGWFKTGDLFYKDEQDYYYFVERKRLLIKHYGFLISPLKIEGIIKRHPSVADACVVCLPDPECQEMPIIAVQRRNGDKVEVKEIYDLIRKNMEGKQVSGGLFFVDSLPVTPSGKVHRIKVKEMALAAREAEKVLY
ncbi:hypothetical protein PYW08_014856 [Mythimna loreyi]|uniref:Uncharacterized protein n=1 Tax=Mythimna loreyi TaxID=667449 RepID=A0ACC2R3P0_9NEOP|nr:hypothetical protein PYW08_014856 [Mythimna loreyi]